MSQPHHPWIGLPERSAAAYKGSCGHVLVVAGSRSMSGAAALTGIAALRTGAGLVTVATPTSSQSIVASHSPCLMVVPLAENDGLISREARTALQQLLRRADVLAIGPGLGDSDELRQITCWLYEELPIPAVFDADALNHLALSGFDLHQHAGPRVLTPHLGEFRRLTGALDLDPSEARKRAVAFAAERRLTLVLKGPHSLISNGQDSTENPTGNAGMATAGTGDVLTGVTAGLLAQGLPPENAAATAAYLHGLAGDLAEQRVGQHALIATDLLAELPNALLAMR